MSNEKRQDMRIEQARAVLREYPDADLSAFRIVDAWGGEVSADDIAADEAARSLGHIAARLTSEPSR